MEGHPQAVATIFFAPMIQQDSIVTTPTPEQEATPKASQTARATKLTPAEVIDRLPLTATPWQQDSAIRAYYKFPYIDWSTRPNPMRTPETKADFPEGTSMAQPLYHAKSLVQPDSVYRPEYAVYRQGVAGDPVPYSIAGDNFITSILLGTFVLAAVSIAKSGNFIQRQLKNFFHTQREGTTVITETSSELRFQFFLLLQAALLFALIFFFYTKSLPGGTSTLPQHVVIAIFTGIIVGYLMVKAMLYSLVGWVFFDKKKNEQWIKSGLFLIASEGILLFPIVMLHAYFGFSVQTTVIYAAVIVVLGKLLSFYKTYIIFFKKNGDFVQSFLYFCAFEVMPLAALWGLLVFMDNYLNVNF